MTSDILYKTLF